jgi:hypothetical protein
MTTTVTEIGLTYQDTLTKFEGVCTGDDSISEDGGAVAPVCEECEDA